MKGKAILNRINLHKRFLADLGESVVSHSDVSEWPLIVTVATPIPLTFALYIFSNTNPVGGRSLKEYKFNIYVPNQKRKQVSGFDYELGMPLLVSYTEDYDVYILYDTDVHSRFTWCANVQSTLSFIIKACCGKVEMYPKKNGEVLIGVQSKYLLEGIVKRMSL